MENWRRTCDIRLTTIRLARLGGVARRRFGTSGGAGRLPITGRDLYCRGGCPDWRVHTAVEGRGNMTDLSGMRSLWRCQLTILPSFHQASIMELDPKLHLNMKQDKNHILFSGTRLLQHTADKTGVRIR